MYVYDIQLHLAHRDIYLHLREAASEGVSVDDLGGTLRGDVLAVVTLYRASVASSPTLSNTRPSVTRTMLPSTMSRLYDGMRVSSWA